MEVSNPRFFDDYAVSVWTTWSIRPEIPRALTSVEERKVIEGFNQGQAVLALWLKEASGDLFSQVCSYVDAMNQEYRIRLLSTLRVDLINLLTTSEVQKDTELYQKAEQLFLQVQTISFS